MLASASDCEAYARVAPAVPFVVPSPPALDAVLQ
jgi:hypothetical protein